jgi:hypothetical protein
MDPDNHVPTPDKSVSGNGLSRTPREECMDQVKRYLGALVAAALALCPLGAAAQDTDPGRREEPIRIQVSVNLFFAGATGESDEAAKLRELARRSIYEMASNECALVQQVLAKTCRLEAVNVSINAQGGGQTGGYTAGGNFTMRATLK